MAIKQQTGKLSLLRVHKRGTKYGPANDQIDVEVVIKFATNATQAYGFQLRPGALLPAHEGMLTLLRDAYIHNLNVTINYDEQPGKDNHILFRVWLKN